MLAEGTMTRAQAIKLGGAALLAGTGMLLFQSPADARRRHKKHRRRRKKVTSTPDQVDFGQQPVGTPSTPQSVEVSNNGTEPVYIQPDLGNNSFSLAPGFDVSAPILPGTSVDVPVVFTPTTPGAQTGSLSVVDANGDTVTATDLMGTGV